MPLKITKEAFFEAYSDPHFPKAIVRQKGAIKVLDQDATRSKSFSLSHRMWDAKNLIQAEKNLADKIRLINIAKSIYEKEHSEHCYLILLILALRNAILKRGFFTAKSFYKDILKETPIIKMEKQTFVEKTKVQNYQTAEKNKMEGFLDRVESKNHRLKPISKVLRNLFPKNPVKPKSIEEVKSPKLKQVSAKKLNFEEVVKKTALLTTSEIEEKASVEKLRTPFHLFEPFKICNIDKLESLCQALNESQLDALMRGILIKFKLGRLCSLMIGFNAHSSKGNLFKNLIKYLEEKKLLKTVPAFENNFSFKKEQFSKLDLAILFYFENYIYYASSLSDDQSNDLLNHLYRRDQKIMGFILSPENGFLNKEDFSDEANIRLSKWTSRIFREKKESDSKSKIVYGSEFF